MEWCAKEEGEAGWLPGAWESSTEEVRAGGLVGFWLAAGSVSFAGLGRGRVGRKASPRARVLMLQLIRGNVAEERQGRE